MEKHSSQNFLYEFGKRDNDPKKWSDAMFSPMKCSGKQSFEKGTMIQTDRIENEKKHRKTAQALFQSVPDGSLIILPG